MQKFAAGNFHTAPIGVGETRQQVATESYSNCPWPGRGARQRHGSEKGFAISVVFSRTTRTRPVKATGGGSCGAEARSSSFCCEVLRSPIPGQEFGDPLGRMVRQAREHVGEPSLWIDVVELGSLDERVDGSRATA